MQMRRKIKGVEVLRKLRHVTAIGIGLGIAVLWSQTANAHHEEKKLNWNSMKSANRAVPEVMLPGFVNADAGKMIYIHKGCIVCHAVGDVGGKSAQNINQLMVSSDNSVFDLAARMWNHSPHMQDAQARVMGKAIMLSGNELGHLTAFVASPGVHDTVKFTDVPTPIRRWIDAADAYNGGTFSGGD